jgi:hypothetical protein
MPDSRSFRGADYDTDHTVVAKVRERLEVSKRAKQNFVMERFSLKKLTEVEREVQYEIKI